MSRIDRAVLKLAERLQREPMRATWQDVQRMARAVLHYLEESKQ